MRWRRSSKQLFSTSVITENTLITPHPSHLFPETEHFQCISCSKNAGKATTIQEQIRIQSHLQKKCGLYLTLGVPIDLWIVRHGGYLQRACESSSLGPGQGRGWSSMDPSVPKVLGVGTPRDTAGNVHLF